MKQRLVLHAGQVGKKRLQAALTAVLIIHNVRPFPRPYSRLRTLRRTGIAPEEWSAKSKKKPRSDWKKIRNCPWRCQLPAQWVSGLGGTTEWDARAICTKSTLSDRRASCASTSRLSPIIWIYTVCNSPWRTENIYFCFQNRMILFLFCFLKTL